MNKEELELITSMLNNMTEGATTAFVVYMVAYVVKPVLYVSIILTGVYQTVKYVTNAVKETCLKEEERRCFEEETKQAEANKNKARYEAESAKYSAMHRAI